MKIKFLGAAGEVTGSSFLVSGEKERILIDMGMFQGRDAGGKNADHSLLAMDIGAVVLSHAHLDHCGRLPVLVKHGFKGKIYATKATIDLTYLVLKDSARLAAGRAEENGGVTLYSEEDVERVMQMFEVVDYEVEKEILGGVRILLRDAGHILGSASIGLWYEGRRLLFSGDLGNSPSTIVDELASPQAAEIVVMESTYGDGLHAPRGEEEGVVAELASEVSRSGGTLLMPAFSLERTQELLLLFDHLKREGKVSNDLPVYMDSPMGLRATMIYERYPQLYNDELAAQKRFDDPFDFPGLIEVEKGVASKKINKIEGAKVIIAGSGMMAGGRVIHHAKRWLPDRRTIVLFTGYQAEGTLGRKVLEGEKSVVIHNEPVEVAARMVEVKSMSGHADQRQLLNWLAKVDGVGRVFLVHGEDRARMVLKEKIEEEIKQKVELPFLREETEV